MVVFANKTCHLTTIKTPHYLDQSLAGMLSNSSAWLLPVITYLSEN